ncbi:MAG TPA: trypsin-like peptidase domain-containing protein [Solirubrobacteraceae bacterium]|nr:trypsin-like peptidase domain-containing protein [Solirubrobacteraceae bacterium]
MPFLRSVAPGLVAVVIAVVALVRSGDDPDPVRAPVATQTPASGPPGFRELYDRVDGVVARVDARRGPEDPPFGNGRRVATGAAFVVDDEGHVVTNAHVVDRARSATLRFGRSARELRARIVGSDRASDLAVLKVDPKRLRGERPLELAPPGATRVGDPVLAVGTPYRLQSSASAGIVSGIGREIQGLTGFSVPDAIQTDAAINPGNSGGPLVDERGRVVGVNSQGRAAGVGFAISAKTLRRVLPQLIAGRRVRTAYLGVSISEIDTRGARVASVASGGPAERAGLREGDRIVSIDGRATTAEGAVTSAIVAAKPGERVTIAIRRDGRVRRLTATLRAQPTRR